MGTTEPDVETQVVAIDGLRPIEYLELLDGSDTVIANMCRRVVEEAERAADSVTGFNNYP
ncbi:MAG TPA: hypothetical protein VFC00_12565 [Micromonosporaceae bacterium]|nr:hypothetical protein [Micromonosporaceae bacterium]